MPRSFMKAESVFKLHAKHDLHPYALLRVLLLTMTFYLVFPFIRDDMVSLLVGSPAYHDVRGR